MLLVDTRGIEYAAQNGPTGGAVVGSIFSRVRAEPGGRARGMSTTQVKE
jgi:hypothetical protein